MHKLRTQLPPEESLNYQDLREYIAIKFIKDWRNKDKLSRSSIDKESAEWFDALRLADISLETVRNHHPRAEPEYPSAADRIEKVIVPIMTVIGVITLPIWWFPFHWYMNPSKKQKAEYAEYRKEQDELQSIWEKENPEKAAESKKKFESVKADLDRRNPVKRKNRTEDSMTDDERAVKAKADQEWNRVWGQDSK